MKDMTKKTFTAPVLTTYGKFEELTQGGKIGGFLDATYQVGTPVGDLTFSG